MSTGKFVLSTVLVTAAALLSSVAVSAECDDITLGALLAQSAQEGASDPDQRREIAETAVSDCPSSPAAHLLLGDALEAEGDLEGAETAYRRAASLDPDLAVPWARLAGLAKVRGDIQLYETYLESAEALAVGDSDRSEIVRAAAIGLSDSHDDEMGYSFKAAENIGEGLRVGSKSIRPKSVSDDCTTEYFIGSKGFGVNLGILFEVSSTQLKPEGLRQVAELGRALQGGSPGERYLIEGHASSEGDPGFNSRLADRRAETIVDLLRRDYGVSAAQLEFVGRGVEYPVLVNGVEDQAKSRRVTVLRLYDE